MIIFKHLIKRASFLFLGIQSTVYAAFDSSVFSAANLAGAAMEQDRINKLAQNNANTEHSILIAILIAIIAIGIGIIYVIKNRKVDKTSKSDNNFVGTKSLDNDSYKIYLTQTYQIEKNQSLEKFICIGKLFESIDDALVYAASIDAANYLKQASKNSIEIKYGKESALKINLFFYFLVVAFAILGLVNELNGNSSINLKLILAISIFFLLSLFKIYEDFKKLKERADAVERQLIVSTDDKKINFKKIIFFAILFFGIYCFNTQSSDYEITFFQKPPLTGKDAINGKFSNNPNKKIRCTSDDDKYPIQINGNTMSGYDFSCQLLNIQQIEDGKFMVSEKCKVEMEEVVRKEKFEVTSSGILVNSERFYRCQ